MTIARQVAEDLHRASWIRKMFDAGRMLKLQKGAENILDFSLGNPLLEPPEAFQQALRDLTTNPPPGLHRYMPNSGFPSTRKAVADAVSKEQGVEIAAEDVMLAVGAAGALNVALHSLLDPGDEVIVLAPYFVEYLFYVQNHQGKVRLVETTEDFDLDIDAIAEAINPKTKLVLINTPNNPTGRVYTSERMAQLGAMLASKEAELGRPIYLMVDTPYARITYDGAENPPLLRDHPNTLIVHSHSKDLGLAGERVGYLVASPKAKYLEDLRSAFVFSNRVLGFLNAPALMQLALERTIGESINVGIYARLRDKIMAGLSQAGLEFTRPEGAFYLFPKSPIEDDVAFTRLLQENDILVVPGSGFGRAGHIRIAYCVEEATVDRAIPRFAEVIRDVRGSS